MLAMGRRTITAALAPATNTATANNGSNLSTPATSDPLSTMTSEDSNSFLGDFDGDEDLWQPRRLFPFEGVATSFCVAVNTWTQWRRTKQ